MSYFRFSVIGGRDPLGRYVNTTRNGHWRPESAARVARRLGIVEAFELSHHIGDRSGYGRGGRVARKTFPLD